jgi:hypothetical protein
MSGNMVAFKVWYHAWDGKRWNIYTSSMSRMQHEATCLNHQFVICLGFHVFDLSWLIC